MYSTYHLSRDAYLSAIVVVRDRLKNRIAMTPAMRASALDDQAISDFVSDYYDQRFVGYDCIPIYIIKTLSSYGRRSTMFFTRMAYAPIVRPV